MDGERRAAGGAHFGLQGIRERVDKLGGVLEIDSTPGRGDAVWRSRSRSAPGECRRGGRPTGEIMATS